MWSSLCVEINRRNSALLHRARDESPREFSGLASHPIYWQDAPSIRPQYKRSSKYYHTHSTIITIDLSHPQDVATVFTLCPPAQGNGVIDGRLSYYGDHTLAHYADAQADHIAAWSAGLWSNRQTDVFLSLCLLNQSQQPVIIVQEILQNLDGTF